MRKFITITFLSKKNVHISRSFLYAILCDQKLGIMIFRKKDLNQSYLQLHVSLDTRNKWGAINVRKRKRKNSKKDHRLFLIGKYCFTIFMIQIRTLD